MTPADGSPISGPGHESVLAEILAGVRDDVAEPERLVLELTEHSAAADVDLVADRLAALRDAGVRIALDDFGAGYSSLGQLRSLPVDILKIDRSLVGEPDGGARSRAAAPLVDVVVQL